MLFYLSVILKHGERIFANDTKQFIAPPNQLLQPLVGDDSMLTMQGFRHRRERRLLMPPFHGERMQAYGRSICELVDKAMSSLSVETQFSARTLAHKIALEVILKVVFGIGRQEVSIVLERGSWTSQIHFNLH